MYPLRFVTIILCATFLSFSSISLCLAKSEKPQKLYVYNWSQYMDPDVIKAFEKKYNVEVIRNFYESNASLFAKLNAGGDRQYDVIFPSSYYVPRLIKASLIQPLNKELIPNLKNIMARFRNPEYDPNGKYSVAYQWGTTGIAYNAKKFPDAPHSWSLLFDPKVNSQYPFSMMEGVQEMFGAACAYLGYDIKCSDKKQWINAAKLLIDTKKRANFNGFTPGTPAVRQLERGNVDVAVTWNVAYVFFKQQDPKAFTHIKYFIPKEGGILWVDTMAIPAHAPHPKLANQFINFILEPEMGAKISDWATDGTPNKASLPLVDEVIRTPPIMPTDTTMDRLYMIPALKERDKVKLQQQLWVQMKSH